MSCRTMDAEAKFWHRAASRFTPRYQKTTMLIQVNFGDIARTDTIDEYVHERVHKELAHFTNRVTRVEVHIHDDNGPSKHAANDKRVTMEARPAGRQPLAVEHTGDNLQKVIQETAGKLGRALTRVFDKAK